MRATFVEVLVVIAIIAVLCGLLVPAVLEARANHEHSKDSGPPVSSRMYTVQHDQHWWVVRGSVFLHHPDCPCVPKTAEKSP